MHQVSDWGSGVAIKMGRRSSSNELQRHAARPLYEELHVRPDQPAFNRDRYGFRTPPCF